MPMQKLDRNQSRIMGAKKCPSLLVPSLWKKYSSTSTAQEMPITPSASDTASFYIMAITMPYIISLTVHAVTIPEACTVKICMGNNAATK